MASVQKFADYEVAAQLNHNNRAIAIPSNKDIDHDRTGENYSLAPERGTSCYDYYKERKAQLYCYNRKDVKSMAGWIITAPKDLPLYDYRNFFAACYQFLSQKYGEENIIQAVVHNDEEGQPHLHCCFIPVVPDRKHGGEKICANDVLTRKELRNFHPELQKYLKDNGIDANINSGITRQQGGNRTVKELKEGRTRDWTVNIRNEDISAGRWV